MTARRLVVMRHAQAAGGALTDLDRPLTPKGRRDAAGVGAHIADLGVAPDAAVISPATRTRQTWDAAARSLGVVLPALVEPSVYEAATQDLLAVLRRTSPDVATLALVGHNPGVHALARLLDDASGEATARAVLARAFPPSAVAVFGVEGPWAALDRARASLLAFGWYAGAAATEWTWLGAEEVVG